VARARCSALLTAAVDVSRVDATSAAEKSSTSRRISTARWRGGNSWTAATNASRSWPRSATTVAGSPTRASGSGCNQLTSCPRTSASSGWSDGAPSPVGNGRRARPSSAFRQALVAMRCSQVRTDAR